jgi:hypothetical protein
MTLQILTVCRKKFVWQDILKNFLIQLILDPIISILKQVFKIYLFNSARFCELLLCKNETFSLAHTERKRNVV